MEKRKLRHLLLIICVSMFLIWLFLPLKHKQRQLSLQSSRQKQEIQRLTEENRHLKEELRLLKEDPQYLEEVARKEIGLAREGEIIYRISPAEKE